MSYDVFIVAAKADREMAKLITRRLRALKMRVWYDAKDEDDVFTSKESAKMEKSASVLVLWSENGVKADEVRAAASQGYSNKSQPLVQVTLDGTKPYAPFSAETLYSLKGFTSRTNVDGWFKTVDALGIGLDRADLADWERLKSSDKAGYEAWKKAHPNDPLSQRGQMPGAGAAGASLAARAGASAGAVGAAVAAGAAASAASAGAAATALAAGRDAGGVKTAGQAVRTSASAAVIADEDIGGFGWGTIAAILAGIAAMLFLAWLWRSDAPGPMAAIGNAGPVRLATCPPGQMPKSMLNILEPGGAIADDTGG